MMMTEKMLERRFSFGGGVSVEPVWRDPIRRDDDDDDDDDDDVDDDGDHDDDDDGDACDDDDDDDDADEDVQKEVHVWRRSIR